MVGYVACHSIVCDFRMRGIQIATKSGGRPHSGGFVMGDLLVCDYSVDTHCAGLDGTGGQ